MVFNPKLDWKDDESGGTPVTAAQLIRIETGIRDGDLTNQSSAASVRAGQIFEPIGLSDTTKTYVNDTIGTVATDQVATEGTPLREGLNKQFAQVPYDAYVVYDAPYYKLMVRGTTLVKDTNPWPVIDAAIAIGPDRSGSIILGRMHAVLENFLQLGNSTKIHGIGGMMKSQVNGSLTLQYQPQTILDFSGQACHGFATPSDVAVTYRCQGIDLKDMYILGSATNNNKSGVYWEKNYAAQAANPDFLGKVGLSHANRVFVDTFQNGFNLDNTADSCSIIDCHVENVRVGIIDGGSETRIVHNTFWKLVQGTGAAAINSQASGDFIHHNEIEPGSTIPGIILAGNGNSVDHNGFNGVSDAIQVSGSDNQLDGNMYRSVTGKKIVDTGLRNRHAFRSSTKAAVSTTFAVPSAADTIVLLDSELWDDDGLHDLTTNTSRITMPVWAVGREVEIKATVGWAVNATGRRIVKILRNGTDNLGGSSANATSAGTTVQSASVEDVVPSAGTYYELQVYQQSGGSLNLDASVSPVSLAVKVVDP